MGNRGSRRQRNKDDALLDYKEIKDQFTGQGIKRTCCWSGDISQEQLQQKREQFWNSRNSGDRDIWLAIRQACEADHLTASILIQAAGITCRDNLTVCLDSQGQKYEVPIHVINNPVSFAQQKQVVREISQIQQMNVKLRVMKTQADYVVSVRNSDKVQTLKQGFISRNPDVEASKIKLLYGGKALEDQQTIESYYIRPEAVIQVYISD